MRFRRKDPGTAVADQVGPADFETTASPIESSPYQALEAAITRGDAVAKEIELLIAERQPMLVKLREVTARANALKAEGKKREAHRVLARGLPVRNGVVALGARIDSLTLEANRLRAVLSAADQYLPPEDDDSSNPDTDPSPP